MHGAHREPVFSLALKRLDHSVGFDTKGAILHVHKTESTHDYKLRRQVSRPRFQVSVFIEGTPDWFVSWENQTPPMAFRKRPVPHPKEPIRHCTQAALGRLAEHLWSRGVQKVFGERDRTTLQLHHKHDMLEVFRKRLFNRKLTGQKPLRLYVCSCACYMYTNIIPQKKTQKKKHTKQLEDAEQLLQMPLAQWSMSLTKA